MPLPQLLSFDNHPFSWGGGGHPTLQNLDPLFPIPYPLSFHILAHSLALSCIHAKLNSFVFKRFRTLCEKHRGWGGVLRIWNNPIRSGKKLLRLPASFPTILRNADSCPRPENSAEEFVTSSDTFDLIVIGFGPAGEKGGAQAAYFGKRAA